MPLTGAAAPRPGTAADQATWVPAFLHALAVEAADALDLLRTPKRAWFSARRAVAGRRRHSRARAAIDLMAATPLVSATSLAAGLNMAVKNETVQHAGDVHAHFREFGEHPEVAFGTLSLRVGGYGAGRRGVHEGSERSRL